MKVPEFYKTKWADYPLEIKGVIKHLQDIFPEGVEGRRVLDGGCGSGIVSAAFVTLGAWANCFGVSRGCVEISRQRAEKLDIKFRFGEVDLVEPDLGEKFDIINSWGVLYLAKKGNRTIMSEFLKLAGMVKCSDGGLERHMMRGTSNEEYINDWMGVPHRTFHTYDEVLSWFEDAELEHEGTNPATGRFRSTSNFVVKGARLDVAKPATAERLSA